MTIWWNLCPNLVVPKQFFHHHLTRLSPRTPRKLVGFISPPLEDASTTQTMAKNMAAPSEDVTWLQAINERCNYDLGPTFMPSPNPGLGPKPLLLLEVFWPILSFSHLFFCLPLRVLSLFYGFICEPRAACELLANILLKFLFLKGHVQGISCHCCCTRSHYFLSTSIPFLRFCSTITSHSCRYNNQSLFCSCKPSFAHL